MHQNTLLVNRIYTAKTLFGLEPILAAELHAIGAVNIEILNRAVQFRGDKSMLYKSNLLLRTALRILRPIAAFEVHDEDDLYETVREIDWTKFLSTSQTFAINGTAKSDRFTHSKYVALKTKDAIVDQFRDRFGTRPSIDTKDPDIWIDVHISDRTCTISLNSSGDTLAKRGYGVSRTVAPINEALAAGIILMAGWDGKTDFTDPMCGSGTFAIEAAMIAGNIPPGRFRHYNFEKWNDFDRQLWKDVRLEAKAAIKDVEAKIVARDIDGSNLGIAKANAERGRVESFISFEQKDFLLSEAENESGVLIMNPPYGERLEQEGINSFYAEIGSRLKHFYEGYEAWIISSNMQALKHIGLRTSKKVPLFNGALECKLHKYEMYKGSKK